MGYTGSRLSERSAETMEKDPLSRAQKLRTLFFATLYISAFTFGG